MIAMITPRYACKDRPRSASPTRLHNRIRKRAPGGSTVATPATLPFRVAASRFGRCHDVYVNSEGFATQNVIFVQRSPPRCMRRRPNTYDSLRRRRRSHPGQDRLQWTHCKRESALFSDRYSMTGGVRPPVDAVGKGKGDQRSEMVQPQDILSNRGEHHFRKMIA